MRKNFAVLPTTRLSRLIRAGSDRQVILSLCDSYTPGDPPEYYFNRNPSTFNAILDFYRLGTLHLGGMNGDHGICSIPFSLPHMKEDIHSLHTTPNT